MGKRSGGMGPQVWVWWLVGAPVDFRCGADRLLVRARELLGSEPLEGTAFALTSFAVVKRLATAAARG